MTVSTLTNPLPNLHRKVRDATSSLFLKPITEPKLHEELLDEELEALFEEDPPLESDWHVAAMNLLINLLRYLWRERDDIYVSGNTSVYFEKGQGRNKFRGPDLYVVKGVKKIPRRSWIKWEENNIVPHFILELASKSTAKFDVKGKKTIYEGQLKTPEYLVYNPHTNQLQGWRLVKGHYEPIHPNEHGWLWCEELSLWLGLASYDFLDGAGFVKTPRFFDQNGQLLPTQNEAEAQARYALEREKEIEVQARKAAEAEIARLKALLAQKQ